VYVYAAVRHAVQTGHERSEDVMKAGTRVCACKEEAVKCGVFSKEGAQCCSAAVHDGDKPRNPAGTTLPVIPQPLHVLPAPPVAAPIASCRRVCQRGSVVTRQTSSARAVRRVCRCRPCFTLRGCSAGSRQRLNVKQQPEAARGVAQEEASMRRDKINPATRRRAFSWRRASRAGGQSIMSA